LICLLLLDQPFLLIDHISFRSCCHYLNDQSHQRSDIGTRQPFWITKDEDAKNFASLHPYSIRYSLGLKGETPEMKAIWTGISLRRLLMDYRCDPSHILSTQTGLTSLDIGTFSPHIQYCTKLLELITSITSLANYKYIPPSLTSLKLKCYHDMSPFDNYSVIDINHHLPHLSSLELELSTYSSLNTGALSPLSQWSSLTKLTISQNPSRSTSLEGLVHNGSFLSPFFCCD
jgi:hypothetical protein